MASSSSNSARLFIMWIKRVKVFGNGRALGNEGPVVEFEHRQRVRVVLGEEIGPLVLAFSKFDRHKLDARLQVLLGQSYIWLYPLRKNFATVLCP